MVHRAGWQRPEECRAGTGQTPTRAGRRSTSARWAPTRWAPARADRSAVVDPPAHILTGLRHAILGAGGVGGLVGGGLAHAGSDVLLLLTKRSHAEYPGALRVQSGALGDFEVEVDASTLLDRPVDALWVAVKATELEPALTLAPPEAVGHALVVPLLNGVDHVALLRDRYGIRVVAASIAVESERVGPGHVVQPWPFAIVNVAPAPGAEALVEELKAAGFTASVGQSEAQVLWTKLATLAPLALGTSSVQRPIGVVRAEPALWALVQACATEICAVA